MADPTWTEIADALADAIAGGTYKGKSIDSQVLGGSGRIDAPCVRITPPRIGFDAFGESWRVDSSEWPVLIYTSEGGTPNLDEDMAFVEAMLDALDTDPTLGGLVQQVSPVLVEAPQPVTSSGPRGRDRQLLQRVATLRMDH